MSEENTAAEPQQSFEIQKLYLKDVSFEAPNSPEVFTSEWHPETSVQLQTEARRLADDVHEVVLNITVTTKSNDQTAYLVELKQGGVFTLQGFAEEQIGHMVGSYCPNLLLPFAREAIADMVTKGGFPGFLLAPVNFDALYAQHLQKQAEEQAGDSEQPATTH